MAYVKTIWRFFLEFLFPAYCLGCRLEGTFLCDFCLQKIPRQKTQVCPLCYKENSGGDTCSSCIRARPDFALDGVLSASNFKEKSLLQKAIHDLKYNFVEDMAGPLAQLYIELLRQNFLEDAVLCPVPLHHKRLQWRGFNQAEILAKNVGTTLGLPVKNLLIRTSFQKAQMELSREERLKNVVSAFELKEEIALSLAGSVPCVVLVDDVATTLSTLNACAATLKKAGIKKVYGLVLARVY